MVNLIDDKEVIMRLLPYIFGEFNSLRFFITLKEILTQSKCGNFFKL